ncbi:MAG: CAP domain-containing protein [Bacillota bacterium]|nr:CAP domain-containing protein [Bacillota bacterium]MDW7683854.1 CAP domain-containing protein [Bacillota bacterium]
MSSRAKIFIVAFTLITAVSGCRIPEINYLQAPETETNWQGEEIEPGDEAAATQPVPGISRYQDLSDENISLINRERQNHGLAELKVSEDLSAVAEWIARSHLERGDDTPTDEIRRKMDSYPGFAVVSFTMNRSSAAGTYNKNFVTWFAENRSEDTASSQGLRSNFLDADVTHTGAACLGATVTEDGQETYKMVFVWVFTPTPPPSGLTSYQEIAQNNITVLNEERASRGLRRLTIHSGLTALALEKAKDLVTHDYFSHDSPRLGSPHEMIVAQLVPLPQMTAENLWKQEGTYHGGFLTGAAEKAHQGLMNSEGHRKNLLHTNYTHIGAACVGGIIDRPDGKLHQVVLVQLFIKE